jgi:hypothetical protein
MIYVVSGLWLVVIFGLKIRNELLVFLPLLISFFSLLLLNFNKVNMGNQLQGLGFLMLLISLVKLWKK